MIKLGLYKIKIFISKGIYKSLVNLILINMMLKPSIIFYTTFRRLHKADIYGNIIYYSASVIQLLVFEVFIEVYVIIWDKKIIESSFLNNFFYGGHGIDLQTAPDRLIWNYYTYLIEKFNGLF